MSRPEDDPDLRLLLGLALRKQVVRADWPRVLRAAETARRFPFVAAALDGVPFDLLPEQVGWLREPLRRSLQRALPDDPALLAEQLGLSARQAQVLLVVLRGSTIGEAAATVVRLDGVGISKEQASRWMTHAADRLTVWLKRRAAQPVKPDRDDRVDDYLRALAEHCSALPPWFPLGLRFSQVQQEVLVVPPADPDVDDEDYRATGGRNGAEPQAGAGVRARPLPWTTALQRFQHVLLVGEPGSGKSWAARGRCLDLATALLASGSSGDPVPVLVIAPRLEDRLGRRADVPAEELPELIASSMPEVLAADERTRTCVADLLRSGEPVELLIDGFDEIRDERPAVARHLPAVVDFLARSGSRFVLTTRPSSVPQYRFTSRTTTCELQPFGEREQLAFVDAWFTDRRERADQVKRWVVGRRLDLLRTPLLIALFCAVADGSSDAPPRSEPDLLHRVLRRLASDEDRHDSLDRRSSVVRARIDVLEQIALSYVADDGLRDAAEISVVEASLTGTSAWSALEALRTAPTVLDDLVATGLVRATEGRRELELEFLHSAVRDYLLARALHRRATWGEYLGRIWAQPEWEPVLAYVAALLDEPDALLLELERRFGDDPLNAARFTAGRALATAVAPVSVERRTRTRDELLILLGSHDALDRSRSAALLAALQDPETAALVRGLVHPSVPTRVVEAALRSVAGGTSTESVNALALCALDPAFTNGERETAVGALAEVGTAEALAVLELVARDAGVQPAVRAAAAFTALRRLDAASTARELLQSEDDERRDVRWSLAERLSVQAAGLEDVLAAATPNGEHVPDPYCRALLATARAAPEEAQRMLAAALPPNDALDLLVGAVELLRTAAERDPTIVTAARFLLDSQQHRRLRWRVAVAVHACRPTTARALWDHLDAELDPRDGLTVAEFVVEDLDRLPPTVASLVRAQVEAGDFGMWTVAALQTADGRPPLADEEPPPAPAAAAPEPEPDLTTLLSASASLPGYWLLREQRRSIPGAGLLREQAASLTHAIAAVDATAWVEAQPGAAGLVEVRLAASRDDQADVELAHLRALWPGRQREVRFTATAFSADVLESRADALLLDGEPEEALTLAQAAIGVRQADEEPPTARAVTLLFAAGCASGRLHSTYVQVSKYLPALPVTIGRILLELWLQAAAGRSQEVADRLETLPRHDIASDGEAAALRILSGGDGASAFVDVRSWASCRRARVLLAAVDRFVTSDILHARVLAARQAADARAAQLQDGWPDVELVSPVAQGSPPESGLLVRIAARQLQMGAADCAAVVYEVALEGNPDDANAVNNHGFCLVPLDRERALKQLERAAAMYGQPFGVNVANRMLLRWLKGEHNQALALAERYHARGVVEGWDGAWLWAMDDPARLLTDADVQTYVAELAVRAARAGGRLDLAEVWEQRRLDRVNARPTPAAPDPIESEPVRG